MRNNVPILLLPGLMNDARVWKHVLDALGTGREVVVAPTHTADTISALAACAADLMPKGRFAVAGFSLGGFVAMEVARQVPHCVAGVALLSTSARADSEEAKQNRLRAIEATDAGEAGFTQVGRGLLPRLLHAAHADDRDLLDLLVAMAVEVGRDGFVRQQRAAMNREDSRDVLRKLDCPALVLCGCEDQVTPPDLSDEMAALLAGRVARVRVPQCGHMSTLERPDIVVDAFLQWVERVDHGQMACSV
jgi:pimeloyl-ACP methyl ester carboxylesterase